ncbi:MAG: hypothetical protein HY820_44275 [Acidobacteria bacterium]|nr:hypothetical protein [Acidobacteriota bacterium]
MVQVLRVGILWLFVASSASAAAVGGTVIIKRKLTKSKVSASSDAYQRGVAVDLASTPEPTIAAEFDRVVVYLEGTLPAVPAVQTAVQTVVQRVVQKNRRFLPDVLAVPAGSQVSFPNQDPIFHNVFSLSKAKLFDLGNYPRDQTRTVTFPKPGIVFVNCHLHPNMSAAIVVTPNSVFARPASDGSFQLPDVPPGKYTIVAWHKTAGYFRQTVTVTGAGAAKVTFFIPVDEPKPAMARR